MSQELALTREAAPGELSVIELKSQISKIQEVMKAAMHEGEHYGKIPGTDKPTLLKAGAEKLALVFRLAPAFEIKRSDLPNGHREFEVICRLTHIPTGRSLGEGVGSCSTMESKYRYRHGEPEPTENPVPQQYWNLRKIDPKKAQELIGGKDFTTVKVDGQWLIGKRTERVENPDIADTYNTVLKMAKKRAQVDATLTATAASDCFTQDVEDFREPAKPADKPPDNRRAKDILYEEVLQHCKGNKADTGKIIKQLTGCDNFKQVTEAAALSALDEFRFSQSQKPQKPDDDIPNDWPAGQREPGQEG